MIKLRERAETLGVVLFFKDTKTNNLKRLLQTMPTNWCLDTGVHFFVTPEGAIETDRSIETIAGGTYLTMRYQFMYSFKQVPESLVTVKAMCLLGLLQTYRENIKILKTIERTE